MRINNTDKIINERQNVIFKKITNAFLLIFLHFFFLFFFPKKIKISALIIVDKLILS